MTYIVEKPATQQTGSERPIITIEFYPEIHPGETEYQYKHPQFVFGDRVTLKNEYPQTEYVVVGLKIIESKTSSGMLLNQPYWKYEITNGEVSYQKEESALSRSESAWLNQTCSSCSHFENFNEQSGRGWCNCFNHPSRTHHQTVGDCILNGSLDTCEDANSTEVVELDRDGHPCYETAPNGYFKSDFVTNADEPF